MAASHPEPVALTSSTPKPTSQVVLHGPIVLDAASAGLISVVARRAFFEAFGNHPANKPQDVEDYLHETYGPGKLLAWDQKFRRGMADLTGENEEEASEWWIASLPREALPDSESKYIEELNQFPGVVPEGRVAVAFLQALFGAPPRDAVPPVSRHEVISKFAPEILSQGLVKEDQVPFMELVKIYAINLTHGTGIGGALVRAWMERCKVFVAREAELRKFPAEAGKVGIAFLGVWEHNLKALPIYERYGFQTFGKHVFTLGDDPQTDLLMGRKIEA